MNRATLWFVKITGLPLQFFYYRKKIFTENGDKALRKIKNGALIVSNHTSVYDYPLIMYSFLPRTIRTLVAEVIYEKNPFLARLMHGLGGIRVDRDSYDFAFISEMVACLRRGQVGLVFPESKIPSPDDRDLLPFKPSYVVIALESGVPIIPVYTNGVYGKKKKKLHDTAKLIIGKPIYASELLDRSRSEKDNIAFINDYVKKRIKELSVLFDEQNGKKEDTPDRQSV